MPNCITGKEKKYHDWLRNMGCCVCGKCAEVHHIKVKGLGLSGTGMKGPHWAVIPLCRWHHSEFHTRGQIDWEEKNGTQLFWLMRTMEQAFNIGMLDY